MSENEIKKKLGDKFNALFEKVGVGSNVIQRYGDIDIAYPSSCEEYCSLGGYSFVKAEAYSDDSEELPIERAYFQMRDGKVMQMTNLGVKTGNKGLLSEIVEETKNENGKTYFKNVSFWCVETPLFIDDEGFIAIDFQGERKDFRILKGPWKLSSVIRESIQKHLAGQMQTAEHVGYDLIAKFIEREYFKRRK